MVATSSRAKKIAKVGASSISSSLYQRSILQPSLNSATPAELRSRGGGSAAGNVPGQLPQRQDAQFRPAPPGCSARSLSTLPFFGRSAAPITLSAASAAAQIAVAACASTAVTTGSAEVPALYGTLTMQAGTARWNHTYATSAAATAAFAVGEGMDSEEDNLRLPLGSDTDGNAEAWNFYIQERIAGDDEL